MKIEAFFDERTSTLSHIVFDEATRDAIVIDPVLDFDAASGKLSTESIDRLATFITANELKLHLTLETHAHADHLSGAQWLKTKFDAPVAIGDRIVEVQESFKNVFGMKEFRVDGSQFDRLLHPNERITVGTLSFTAIATPGHTPACMSYNFGDAVFTGDALFLDDLGVGRCDFPKGDAATLYESITKGIFLLPPTTKIYVGHDYPPASRSWNSNTTVAQARLHNAQINEAISKEEFVAKRTARDRSLSAPRLLLPSLQVNIAAGRLPEADATGRRYLKLPLIEP